MEAQAVSQNSPKLLDRLRIEIRVRHYSIRTEDVHVDWARRFHSTQLPGYDPRVNDADQATVSANR